MKLILRYCKGKPWYFKCYILLRCYLTDIVYEISKFIKKHYLKLTVKKVGYYDIMTNIDKPKWYKFRNKRLLHKKE